MNRFRRSGEVPNLDLNIFVHWCTPVAFGMRHGHRISGYSSHRLSISALERALIDDLFDDIFLVFFSFFFQILFSVVVSIFGFPIGSFFCTALRPMFRSGLCGIQFRVNRVFLFDFF